MKIGNVIVGGVSVDVMNVITVGNFSVVICPYNTVKSIIRGVVPAIRTFSINFAKKTLVFVINNFNGGRIGQIFFEYVNTMAFKVVVGKLAKFSKQFGNTFGIFHENHSLRFLAGRAIMIRHGKPCALTGVVTSPV